MGVETLISIDEYLRSSYSPDKEYVDGVLVEINVGDPGHGAVQRNIGAAILYRYPDFRAYPELRSRTRETRFRLPAVAIVLRRAEGGYLAEPPFIAIEILSQADRLTRLIEKLKEYVEWGVPNIWVMDPRTRSIYVFREGDLIEVLGDVIATDAPHIELTRSEIFWD